jgi:hypothetical protein
MQARFFAASEASRWDQFCAESYCSTFLHTRRFLSYHGERFVDRSIVIDAESRWLGVLPAALHPTEPGVVVSHPGITYGGVVHQGDLRGTAMLDALRAVSALLRSSGIERLHYKALPHIYHRAPAQDDLYALFRLGAVRYRCDLSTSIDLQRRLPLSERRRRSLKKAAKAALSLESGAQNLAPLWQVLEANLRARHDVAPTHSAQEIEMLAERFPESIDVMVARHAGAVVAGLVLFKSEPTVHLQYIASSDVGQELSALDALIDRCIEVAVSAGARYLDFGISTEAQGSALNDGLYRFKSEFGGSGVVHEFYEIDVREAR